MKFRISLTSLYSILSLPSSVLIFPEFSLMLASHVPRESKSKFTYNTNFQTVSRFMRTMMITASRVMHWLLGNVFGFWCMIGAIGNNAAFFEQRPARCNWITRIALNDRYLWRHNSLYVNLPVVSNDRPRCFQRALNAKSKRGWSRTGDGWWRGRSPNDLRWTRGYRDRAGSRLILGRSRRCNSRLRGLGWRYLLCWC